MLPETELVVALCRTPLSEATRNRVRALLASPIDWESFFGRAAQWQLEPVVMANLRSLDNEAIPGAVRERVIERERESRGVALSRTLMMMELLKSFEREGIATVVLKGPALGVSAYGDPSLRTFGDMDLLVRKHDLPAARELLLSSGYERNYVDSVEESLVRDQHALEFSSLRAKVEVHWTLLSRHLRLDFGVEDLWKSARTVPCVGHEIRVLAPDVQFLFLCAHGAKHKWISPRWICDVAQLAKRLEPDNVSRVLLLASRLHAKRILALGLRLARDFAEDSEALFPMEALVPEADTRRLASSIRRELGLSDERNPGESASYARLEPGFETLVFWARTRERWIDRAACVGRVLFVPTEKDEGRYLLPWVRRPIRLAARAIRRAATAS